MLRRVLSFALLPILAVAGCGSEDSAPAAPTDDAGVDAGGDVAVEADASVDAPADVEADVDLGLASAVLGDTSYSLRFDRAAATITLTRGTDPQLVVLSRDALQVGTVTTVSDTANYDPYFLYVKNALHPDPAGLAWSTPTSWKIAEATATRVVVELGFDGGLAATLTVEAGASGAFHAKLSPTSGASSIAFLRVRAGVDAHEGFYGLGEWYDSVQHRGKVRAMQLEADTSFESGYNEAHVPVPLVVGTRGWGLFVESRRPGAFDVASRDASTVEATFGTGVASADGLAFHLFAAGHPLDVTRHYYELTGRPRLPARWALGPWIWRDENKDEAEVLKDVHAMRDLDIAGTAIWIDRPYATGVETFDFEAARFPTPQAMIDEVHALGFRMALWQAPYLDEADASTQALRDEATQKGYYPPVVGVKLNKWGTLLDLTNPEAFDWWQGHVRAYADMGIEGFKLDYGEDVAVGLSAGRNTWKFADGSDERTMHGAFQLFYHRAYAETLPSEGGFLLCRHGAYGDQTITSVIWPGDLDATFSRRGDPNPDPKKSTKAVGGLPASLIAGLGLGPSGYPFYGADTGGYVHSPPDKELFARWCEQTALSTVMQSGNSENTVPWEADATTGYDAELRDIYSRYARLHLRLFPYEWTYAQKLATDGRAIARPVGLAYPELGEHPDDEYTFGDDLLVAPIVDRGARTRKVRFPGERWLHWWTGALHQGGANDDVAAPLDELPLFLREGGIVAMLRPTIDTTSPTTTPELVDSYATTPGVLYARIFGSETPTATTLFDGSAIGQWIDASVAQLSFEGGTEFTQGAMLELVAVGAEPSGVTIDGNPVSLEASLDALASATSGWLYRGDVGGTAWVRVPPGQHAIRVSLATN